MKPGDRERIWKALSTRGGRSQPSVSTLLRTVADNDIDLTPQELWELSTSLKNRLGTEHVCPPAVSDFVVGLLDGVEASCVLDPCVGFGTLLRPVVETLQPTAFVGIAPTSAVLEGAEVVLPSLNRGEYRLGGCDGAGLEPDDEFDVAVSVLALVDAKANNVQRFTIDGIGLRDQGSAQLLLRSGLRLRPSGVGVFVVGRAFLSFVDYRSECVAAQLEKFGLFIEACFLLPGGTLLRGTNIESWVVVIRRGEAPKRMFIAEASASTARRKTVLANYRRGEEGVEPELGSLVDRQEFKGLRQLVAAKTLERQTKRLELEASRLGDLCISVDTVWDWDRIPDVDNAFFFPLWPGTDKCSFDVGSLPTETREPQKRVLVRVDPRLAEARVVAGFLDGPLGRLSIESQVRSVGGRAALLQTDLPNLQVFLPNLEEQAKVVEIDQRIRSLVADLDALRTQLWRRLDKSDEVAAKVDQVNREDTFPLWLDRLPFPLASILWMYHTKKGEPRRYSRLDHFFEGLAQFLAVLVLSATRRDNSVFPRVWNSVLETLRRGKLSLERPTFGTWVRIFERLAKLVRADLSDRSAAEHWQRLFACDDLDLLAGVVNKRMVTTLNTANQLRNSWRGHGGYISSEMAHRREREYRDLLLKFRELVGNRWQNYPLVLPGKGEYSKELHRYEVKQVVGTRVPFDVARMEVKEPMESGVLHMAAPRLGLACPLLPLMRLGPSPEHEETAFYFFNRVEGDGLKYVSYHFTDKPEILENVAETRAVLAELSARDQPGFTDPPASVQTDDN